MDNFMTAPHSCLPDKANFQVKKAEINDKKLRCYVDCENLRRGIRRNFQKKV